MSRVVYRYTLGAADRQVVAMPGGADILHVGRTRTVVPHAVDVWAAVDPDRPTVDRAFLVVGTGNPIPDTAGRHIGSVDVGAFVWHVFEDA